MAAILAGIAIVVLTGLFVGGGEGPQDTTEGDTVTIEAGMDYGDCANASVVIVPEGRVDVIKEYAKQLVDDGKLLYIQDVAWSKEALGEALSIPLAHSSIHNPMPHVATAIYQAGGRYVYSSYPFRYCFQNGNLLLESDYEPLTVVQAGSTLKEAYLAASAAYFPPTGNIPEELFFSKPQYNTWIELMYNQNQADIENYARQIINNGFPNGILMIDDNWQNHYGNFDFKPEKFPDPKGMVDRLHQKGFKVMLWVCPYVTPDSPEARYLEEKGYLIKSRGTDAPAIVRWWNGSSACIDLTNPSAFNTYGGFKVAKNCIPSARFSLVTVILWRIVFCYALQKICKSPMKINLHISYFTWLNSNRQSFDSN